MKKENIIKDLSIYNINTFSSKFYNNHKNNNQTQEEKSSNFINKFKLECVIGKGGFGKVSNKKNYNNIFNRSGKLNIN